MLFALRRYGRDIGDWYKGDLLSVILPLRQETLNKSRYWCHVRVVMLWCGVVWSDAVDSFEARGPYRIASQGLVDVCANRFDV